MKTFNSVKIGECFLYESVVYRKTGQHTGQIIGYNILGQWRIAPAVKDSMFTQTIGVKPVTVSFS